MEGSGNETKDIIGLCHIFDERVEYFSFKIKEK